MGNCYGHASEYSADEIQQHLRKSKINQPKIPSMDVDKGLSELNTSIETESNVIDSRFLDVIDQAYIRQLVAKVDEHKAGFDLKKQNTILKKALKTMQTPFEIYFKQEKVVEESAAKPRRVHNLFAKMNTAFNAEASMLYELNTKEEMMKKIDSNTRSYEVLRTEHSEDGNTILQLVLMKTKKFLIVKSKSFLTMRVCQRVSDSEFTIVGESVLRNELSNQRQVKQVREEIENECEIFLTGSRYGGCEGDFTYTSFTRGDFKTSTGNAILKPIFKKTFNKYYNANLKGFIDFILSDHSGAELLWFGQNQEEVARILKDQRMEFLKLDVEIPDLFVKEVKEKLAELRGLEEYQEKEEEEVVVEVIQGGFSGSEEEEESREIKGGVQTPLVDGESG